MSQFESFAAYFGRLITFADFAWIGVLMIPAFALRKPLSQVLKVSRRRFLLIGLSFACVFGLSLRFWVASGTLSIFWLVAPEVWSAGWQLNANFVLNVALYIPPAVLLVLARKSWWKVSLFLIAMSFSVETLQQFTRIGSGDPFDWFANSLGANIGVIVGVVVARFWPALAEKR